MSSDYEAGKEAFKRNDAPPSTSSNGMSGWYEQQRQENAQREAMERIQREAIESLSKLSDGFKS